MVAVLVEVAKMHHNKQPDHFQDYGSCTQNLLPGNRCWPLLGYLRRDVAFNGYGTQGDLHTEAGEGSHVPKMNNSDWNSMGTSAYLNIASVASFCKMRLLNQHGSVVS